MIRVHSSEMNVVYQTQQICETVF